MGEKLRVTDRFASIPVDLEPIGLIRGNDMGGYLCTPKNAVTFANTGSDGIHFCVVPVEGDSSLERSPVYVISRYLKLTQS